MGCYIDRSESSNEESVKSAEKYLGFDSISSLEFDRLVHRYSSNSEISQLQLITICESLEIKESSVKYNFLYSFIDQNSGKFNSQILATAGILLGSGKKSEKFKLLFMNYDLEISDVLSYADVKQMISDLVSISIDKLCQFTNKYLKNTESKDLTNYRLELVKGKNVMIGVYTRNIMEDDSEVSLSVFINRFNEADNLILFNPSKTRIISKIMAKQYLNLTDKKIDFSDNDIFIDLVHAKMLSSDSYNKYSKKYKKKKKKE